MFQSPPTRLVHQDGPHTLPPSHHFRPERQVLSVQRLQDLQAKMQIPKSLMLQTSQETHWTCIWTAFIFQTKCIALQRSNGEILKDPNEQGLGLTIPDHFGCAGAQHQVGADIHRRFTISIKPHVSSLLLVARDWIIRKILDWLVWWPNQYELIINPGSEHYWTLLTWLA